MNKRPWSPLGQTEEEVYRANNALLILEDKAPDMAELLINLEQSARDGNVEEMFRTARLAIMLLAEGGYEPTEQTTVDARKEI